MNRLLLIIFLLVSHFSLLGQNKELKKLYLKGKYDKVVDKVQTLIKEETTNPDVMLFLGKAYVNLKQYKEAIPILEELIVSDRVMPENKAVSKAYLAKCLFVKGQKKRAVNLLKACQDGRESKDAIKYARKYLCLFQEDLYFKSWEVVETENIRFHFQDKKKLGDFMNYINKAQLIFERHIGLFKCKPGKKVDVFVWADQNEAFRKFNRTLAFSNSDLLTVNVLYNQRNDFELCNVLTRFALQPSDQSMLIKKVWVCIFIIWTRICLKRPEKEFRRNLIY